MTDKVSHYTGEQVEIVFDRKRCIHAGECGRGSKALFNIANDPWCSPDAVSAEEAAAVVGRCPTGALTLRRLDGGALPTAPGQNRALISPNGPIYLQGDLRIEGDDQTYHRLALCRCGASKNKPFCDLSHNESGFKDAGAVAGDAESVALEPGPLTITPYANGPVVVNGPLSILSASGREAFRGKKAALCRCGASSNRPFCDGAHKTVGFSTED